MRIRGHAALQLEQYEGAVTVFEQLASCENKVIQLDAKLALSQALARLQRYQESLDYATQAEQMLERFFDTRNADSAIRIENDFCFRLTVRSAMISAMSAKVFAYRQLSMDKEAEDTENDLKIVMEPIKKQLSLRLDMDNVDGVGVLALPSLDSVVGAPGAVRSFK